MQIQTSEANSSTSGGNAQKGNGEPLPAIPFPYEPLPQVPLVVPKENYIIFTPNKAAFWPCVGMYCPGTEHKQWVVIDNSAFLPTASSTTESEIPNWINLEGSAGTKAPPAATAAEKDSAELREDSDPSSSASEDKPNTDTTADSRRPIVWALYTQPVPADAPGTQPFGNLHQTARLDVHTRIVTHMRRAYICPNTGNLEIPKVVPGSDRYSLHFIWPETSPPEPTINLHDASSSSTDPNIVDEAPSLPRASREPLIIETSFERIVEEDFDVSIASLSETATEHSETPARKYLGPESGLVWSAAFRLLEAMAKSAMF